MVRGSTIASVMMSSSSAMAQLTIISLVGIIAAKYPKNEPILPPASLRYLSRLTNVALLPCLILKSLGGNLSVPVLFRIGILGFFNVVITLVSYLVADVVGFRIHGEESGGRDSELFTTIRVAIGNGNAISLPILVMDILCEDPLINADYESDAGQCYDEASSMIFVYMIFWNIMYGGYGLPVLRSLKIREMNKSVLAMQDSDALQVMEKINQESNRSYLEWIVHQAKNLLSNHESRVEFAEKIKKIFSSPPIYAVAIALPISLIHPIRKELFTPQSHLSIVGSTLAMMGEPVVTMNCLIMAASIAHCDFPFRQATFHYLDHFLFDDTGEKVEDKNDDKPKSHAVKTNHKLSSEEVSNPLQVSSGDIETQLYSFGATRNSLGSSSMKSIAEWSEMESVVDPNTDVIFPCEADEQIKEVKKFPSSRSIASLLICKLLLIPIVMLLLNSIFLSIGLIDRSQKMMLLMIILQSASPSAQVLIVSLNQLGLTQAAGDLSFLYVFLYGASVLTVTLWTAVAMSLYIID